MDESQISRAMMQIAREQGEVASALKALTDELRNGFARGTKRIDEQDQRLRDLERKEARRTGVVAACLAMVSFLGVERLLRALGVDL